MSASPSDESRWAVPLILTAMLCFALQDMAVKLVAEEASIWEMQAIRSGIVLVLLWVMVQVTRRPETLVPRRWRWPLIRAALMLGAYLCFYTSLPLLTLSQAGAAFYVGPLLITVLAALLLGEPIGPRRIGAVVVGFLGVLLIVRPGTEDWEPAALLPVGSAACYALAVVATRWRCREEHGTALTFTHNLLYAVVGVVALPLIPFVPVSAEMRADLPFLLTGWNGIGLMALGLLAATAFTHTLGMISSVSAYKGAEASKIAPFEYSYLLMMPIFDFVIWSTVPDELTLGGMALIIASGAFVAWREGRPARPRVQFKGEVPWTPEAEVPEDLPPAASDRPK